MRILVASDPGSVDRDNEDWVHADEGLVIVVDGATARTETGCIHGVSWYARRLGENLVRLARDLTTSPTQALAEAISQVASEHRGTCDLTHPGTPSAGIGIVRFRPTSIEYLVLGDVTVVIDQIGTLTLVTDDRVSHTAAAERAEADQHPIGSPEKAEALLAMKRAELAARNVPGGYWIAEADPRVVQHALTGTHPVSAGTRVGVLSDGAARAATLGLVDWPGAIDLLCTKGPAKLIALVREAEAADPYAVQWPRNKCSDDATAVCIHGFRAGTS
jgi:hypothetical protein